MKKFINGSSFSRIASCFRVQIVDVFYEKATNERELKVRRKLNHFINVEISIEILNYTWISFFALNAILLSGKQVKSRKSAIHSSDMYKFEYH